MGITFQHLLNHYQGRIRNPMVKITLGFKKILDERSCGRAGGCFEDVLQTGLEELKVYKNDSVVAVNSACQKFKSDEYCCSNKYDSKTKCQPDKWKVDYTNIFKRGCPHALTYKFDEKDSKFTCSGSNGRLSPDYNVQFC